MKSKGLDKILASMTILGVGFIIFSSFSGLSNIIENKQNEGIHGLVSYGEGQSPIQDNPIKLSENDKFKTSLLGSNAFDECLIAC